MIEERDIAVSPPVDAGTVERSNVGVTLASLAALKRLPVSELKSHGCSDYKLHGRSVVRIPYVDANGETLAVRFRNALCKSESGPDARFRWRTGDKAAHLYGLDLLPLALGAGYALVFEGESDCWTAWHYDISCLGVPGKANWKQHMAVQLEGLEVYVWQEPGAEDFTERVCRDIPGARVILAPEGIKDISEAHVAGRDVVSLVAQLRQSAVTFDSIAAQRRDDRLPALHQAALPVLEHPDPIEIIRDAIRGLGYGGDLRPPLLVYLAMTGRVLAMRTGAMPAHMLLLGPASAGKSYTLGTTLRLMPEAAYHTIDAGSPRVLIYDDAELAHRVVIFGESDSLPAGEDNPAASAVRNLLQDHNLHYAVTERSGETHESTVRHIRKPGPTTLVTTSTRRLGHQLDTRLFILEVSDDHAQIGFALEKQADLELRGGTPEPPESLIALQSYLQATAPWDVVVPFVRDIPSHLASQPAEQRVVRDLQRVLTLVKACAVLRQEHRLRDDDGRLIADLEDYATVYELVADVYKSSTSAGPKIREIVQAVEAHLAKGHRCASQADLRVALDLGKSSVSRRVSDVRKGGWLVDDESRSGYPARLRLGEALPPEHGLPTPESLGRSTVPPLTAGKSAARVLASLGGDTAPTHEGRTGGTLRDRSIGSSPQVPESDVRYALGEPGIPVVDEELFRAAARQVVAQCTATAALLVSRCDCDRETATAVLGKLASEGVVGPAIGGRIAKGDAVHSVLVDEKGLGKIMAARGTPCSARSGAVNVEGGPEISPGPEARQWTVADGGEELT